MLLPDCKAESAFAPCAEVALESSALCTAALIAEGVPLTRSTPLELVTVTPATVLLPDCKAESAFAPCAEVALESSALWVAALITDGVPLTRSTPLELVTVTPGIALLPDCNAESAFAPCVEVAK